MNNEASCTPIQSSSKGVCISDGGRRRDRLPLHTSNVLTALGSVPGCSHHYTPLRIPIPWSQASGSSLSNCRVMYPLTEGEPLLLSGETAEVVRSAVIGRADCRELGGPGSVY